MKTFKRICIRDHLIEDQEGTQFQLNRGEEYITSAERDDHTLVVFSRYWVNAPADIFAGELPFTK